LTDQQHEQLSRWLAKHYAGSDNGGKPLVMDRAAKWSQQMMSGVDAQHLETRKHQVEEICRAMRVIPMMAGYSDKTSTYASAEQMFIAHVVHTITPWATRIEQSAERALLADETDIDIRFDLKGLMRGAAKDRAEYLSRALGSGGSPAWMTQNEARYEDGLDWIEGGDELPKLPTQMQADGGEVDAAA
jgi:HK97 family phage portal protein